MILKTCLVGNWSQAQPGVSLYFWNEWQQRQTINPGSHSFTSKCFGPRTALLLGAGVWHFSALSLWGCNINKASLKVYQLLKLSRSLPITVTKQSVQHKNMFPLCNSQQTWQMGGWCGHVFWHAPDKTFLIDSYYNGGNHNRGFGVEL